jgi:hypothetical protein
MSGVKLPPTPRSILLSGFRENTAAVARGESLSPAFLAYDIETLRRLRVHLNRGGEDDSNEALHRVVHAVRAASNAIGDRPDAYVTRSISAADARHVFDRITSLAKTAGLDEEVLFAALYPESPP